MDIISTPWTPSPNRAHIGPKSWFAIGDVHGQADAFEAALTALPSLADGRYGLVLLGDLVDRGPDSMRCLELAENAADLSGADEVVKLPGNHELMMLDLAHRRDEAFIWLDNGGDETLNSMESRTGILRSYAEIADGLKSVLPDYWLNEAFPTHHIAGDYVFVHAGISPHQDTETFLAKSAKKSRLQAMERGHWAWIRWSFLQHAGMWPDAPNRCVVHGHTPALRSAVRDADTLARETLFPDGLRRVCLDGGAAILPQILIGQFKDDQARVHALRDDPGWLP